METVHELEQLMNSTQPEKDCFAKKKRIKLLNCNERIHTPFKCRFQIVLNT